MENNPISVATIKFLKSKRAWSKFLHNANRKNRQKVTEAILRKRYFSIGSEFFWTSSTEGNDFWRRLNEEFERKYYEND